MTVGAWGSVTIGVADLDAALALWRDAFGFETTVSCDGVSDSFAGLLGVAAADVSRQAILVASTSVNARLHLIEFADPGPAVRDGAQVFDLCAKNLDVYVADMPERMRELGAAGFRFRNDEFSEVQAPDGTRFREIHLPAHDAINVVLLEVLDGAERAADDGYGGVGPLILIVADAAAEKRFFERVVGLAMLADNQLDGPEIERMIGLPAGARLDVSIWGDAAEQNGQIEIIRYEGTDGTDLYPRARAPATGILDVSYDVPDLDAMVERLNDESIDRTRIEAVELPDATIDVIDCRTPAGLRIQFRAAT